MYTYIYTHTTHLAIAKLGVLDIHALLIWGYTTATQQLLIAPVHQLLPRRSAGLAQHACD